MTYSTRFVAHEPDNPIPGGTCIIERPLGKNKCLEAARTTDRRLATAIETFLNRLEPEQADEIVEAFQQAHREEMKKQGIGLHWTESF